MVTHKNFEALLITVQIPNALVLGTSFIYAFVQHILCLYVCTHEHNV